jgi:hypothetical protein
MGGNRSMFVENLGFIDKRPINGLLVTRQEESRSLKTIVVDPVNRLGN